MTKNIWGKQGTRQRVLVSALRGYSDAAGAFSSNGYTIFSYRLPIARIEQGVIVALPACSVQYSHTTSEHQHLVLRFEGKGEEAFSGYPREAAKGSSS